MKIWKEGLHGDYFKNFWKNFFFLNWEKKEKKCKKM